MELHGQTRPWAVPSAAMAAGARSAEELARELAEALAADDTRRAIGLTRQIEHD